MNDLTKWQNYLRVTAICLAIIDAIFIIIGGVVAFGSVDPEFAYGLFDVTPEMFGGLDAQASMSLLGGILIVGYAFNRWLRLQPRGCAVLLPRRQGPEQDHARHCALRHLLRGLPREPRKRGHVRQPHGHRLWPGTACLVRLLRLLPRAQAEQVVATTPVRNKPQHLSLVTHETPRPVHHARCAASFFAT